MNKGRNPSRLDLGDHRSVRRASTAPGISTKGKPLKIKRDSFLSAPAPSGYA